MALAAARVIAELNQARASSQAPALKRLRLQDFRNYASLDVTLADNLVVLFGANGAGKTNFLEAISLLSPGRGLRRAALEEMDRDGGGPFGINARIDHQDGPLDLTTRRDPISGRRISHLADKPLKGPAALAELFSITWLTPAMDRLFLDAASSRRRFLDRMVLNIQSDHATRIGRYERSLRERTAVLRGGHHDPAWLDALENRIAETGVAIAAARIDLIEALNPVLIEHNIELPKIRLNIEGEIENMLRDQPALMAENHLAAQLKAARERDRQSGGAATGPHKSDLHAIDLTSNEAASRVSTGRQKSVLLALILGEARLRQRLIGDLPVMLMDEVAAHLDASRREQLCQNLIELGAQVFLTGTDRQLFAPLNHDAQFLEVNSAQIQTTGDPP